MAENGARLSPLLLAQSVARNIVPVVGIVAFGWPAFNVLALYFVDTMLAIALLCALVGRTFVAEEPGAGAGLQADASSLAAGLFIAAFVAVPLGIPLIFMANGSFGTIAGTLRDRSFWIGVAIQAALALWTWWGMRHALAQGATRDSLRLKRQFALVFLRWVAVLAVVYLGVGQLAGRWAPALFVVVYVVASIVIDVAPDRFLRAMPGGAEDADDAAAPGSAAARRADRKRRGRG